MIRAALALTLLWWAGGSPGEPQVGSARVTVAPSLTFTVPNVTVATVSGPITISFNQAVLTGSDVVRISVKADGDLTKAGVPSIPASFVSWVASGATNGSGTNGTLSTSTYTQVFQGAAGKKNGNVDLTWTLAAPGLSVRAGTYQMTLRWKFEAVVP